MPVREEKVAAVSELKEKMNKARAIFLCHYRGLTVAEMNELRRKAKENDSQVMVVKNTLARRAALEAGVQDIEPLLKGPIALTFGYGEDGVETTKLVSKLQKEFKFFQIQGGVLQGNFISPEDVEKLAELPPKEVLLGKLTGSFQAPLYGLVNVLQGNIRKLAYVLEAVREQKAAGE